MGDRMQFESDKGMSEISEITEKRLRTIVLQDSVWAQIDPVAPPNRLRYAEEVRIGSFRLDLVASNAAGGITIIELKVCASKDTLAQLLLYPRAFETHLQRRGLPHRPELRMVLVTTYLDKGVVDLIGSIRPPCPTLLRVCVAEEAGYFLRSPREVGEERQQVWDQAGDPTGGDITIEGDRVFAKGVDLFGGNGSEPKRMT